MSLPRFGALFGAPSCDPRVKYSSQCISMAKGLSYCFWIVKVVSESQKGFGAFSDPFSTSCFGPRIKLPSQCTHMAIELWYGFWIMKISPLVSEIRNWPQINFSTEQPFLHGSQLPMDNSYMDAKLSNLQCISNGLMQDCGSSITWSHWYTYFVPSTLSFMKPFMIVARCLSCQTVIRSTANRMRGVMGGGGIVQGAENTNT